MTMRIFKLLILLLLAIMVSNCSNKLKYTGAEKIQIEWELISNINPNQPGAQAKFIIHNKSKTTLGSSNWILYFSMAPRTIISASDTSYADVMHINGDWYKLVPRNNFILASGETQVVYYNFKGWNIKECDAPEGLYFAMIDADGREKEIVPVDDYTIRPFIREEQITRSINDQEPFPTPEYLFRKYEALQLAGNSNPLPLIPTPQKIKLSKGKIVLDPTFSIIYHPKLKTEAVYLAKKIKEISGLELKLLDEPVTYEPRISLIYKPADIQTNSEEDYQLSISQEKINITGQPAGVFYGIQSLLQLIPFEVYEAKPGKIDLPVISIDDTPRFAYRGQHIDVCRNFQTKEQLLKVIDLMAIYKLNRLHLYLTEDEAWRLEIKGLPELTEVGSRRGHTLDESDHLPPAYGSGALPDVPDNHGTGYYTREDFKEIIKYAHERHIKLIPGINLPGHARAAIKSMEVRYNRLMDEGKESEAEEFRLIDPDDQSIYRSAQFYNDNVVCVARESVYRFYETVIDDVLLMYKEAGVPIDMINTGGDEVPEGAWTKSPLCAELLEKLTDVNDPKNLQKYFFRRIVNMLADRGVKIGGWEEVALVKSENWQYEVNPEFADSNVIPYIWNNLSESQDLAYRVANAGYPVVLSAVSNFYFDLAYSKDPKEPGLAWGGFNDERDAWEIAPYNMFIATTKTGMGKKIDTELEYANMERLTPHSKKNILGLQAQLWHETIKGGEMMEYYLLPKMIAFAERCWSPAPEWGNITDIEKRSVLIDSSWQQFSNTLYYQELPKLNYLNGGYNYRIPPAGFIIQDGYLIANSVSPNLIIRYTTDGSEPDKKSSVYTSPIKATGKLQLKVFDRAGRSGRLSGRKNMQYN